MKPWQNCPPCPECLLPCGTQRPALAETGSMHCTACGHEWREADPVRIEQARVADEAWRMELARIDDVCAAQLGLPRRAR